MELFPDEVGVANDDDGVAGGHQLFVDALLLVLAFLSQEVVSAPLEANEGIGAGGKGVGHHQDCLGKDGEQQQRRERVGGGLHPVGAPHDHEQQHRRQ